MMGPDAMILVSIETLNILRTDSIENDAAIIQLQRTLSAEIRVSEKH